jgi:hypothetical protein
MTDRIFPLGDVLSITTGRLLSESHVQGIYEILNHMTGESLYTHQLPRAVEVCAPVLRALFPALVGEDPTLEGADELKVYLTEAKERLGNSFPVPALNKTDYVVMNPLVELATMLEN